MPIAFAHILFLAICLCATSGVAQVTELGNQQYNAPYRNMSVAYANYDTASMARVYAKACVYVPESGTFLLGNTAVQAMYSKFLLGLQAEGAKLRVSFSLIHRSVQAGVVTDVGFYRLEFMQGDRATFSFGKFITQAIEENGAYRFALDTDRSGATEADFLGGQPVPFD